MRLFQQELKKIWQPWILAAIFLLGLLYYYMFPQFYIKNFSNGIFSEAEFDLTADWAKTYGTTLEPEERQELTAQLAQEKLLFCEKIAEIPEAAALELTDYDSLNRFQEDYYKESLEKNDSLADMDIEKFLWHIIGSTNYPTIQTLEQVLETYDGLEKNMPPNLNYDSTKHNRLHEKKLARIEKLKASPARHGYLPNCVLESTNAYSGHLITWCILSVILLLCPVFVRDRLHHVQNIQYSSRHGRHTLSTQMAAALLSGLLLTLLNLIAYGIPFLLKQPLLFKDFGLFSFLAFYHPWLDISYGGYLLLLAAICMLLSLAAAGFTAVFSHYSSSYIAMLFKALPLFVVLNWLSTGIVDRAFFFMNRISNFLQLPGAEALCTGVLVVGSLGAVVFTCILPLYSPPVSPS